MEVSRNGTIPTDDFHYSKVDGIDEMLQGFAAAKMLALSFLIFVGVVLIGEGLEMQVPKGYIYFATGFSVMVEMLRIRVRKKSARSVTLYGPKASLPE